MNDMDSFEWLLCPVCNSKTRIKLRLDTELKTFLCFVLMQTRNFNQRRKI